MKFSLDCGTEIGNKVFFIAEAGINHNGSIDIAKQLIDKAKFSGADCVKFQKRTISRILTKDGLNQPYNNERSFGETYGKHKEHLEFSFEQFRELKSYADSIGILFSASGWDEESVDFLDSLDVPFFKVASADLTNFPLLTHTANKKRPIFLSTGMSDFETVLNAVDLILQCGNNRIVLMQCTSSYPTPTNEINLNVLKTYQAAFSGKVVVGYSGHENGIAISTAAVALGAKVIERHFTLDRTMKGGDHAASLEIQGLTKLIRDIKIVEEALGDYNKTRQPSEEACFKKLTKSVVSAVFIPKSTTITRDMLTVKGPGTGISPMDIDLIVGMVANIDIKEDCIIKMDQLC